MPSPVELLGLKGRVAVVTGADSPIGVAIAQRLGEAGAAVILGVRSGRRRADATAAELGERGAVVAADLLDPDGPDGLVRAAIDRFGRIDIVVNNAALQPVADLADTDAAAWDAMAATNVRAAHLMIRSAAAAMTGAATGGAVVNIGSIEGRQPAPGHGHYAASKAALAMLTRAAALEFGPAQIRVNSVAPGLIDDGHLADRWPEGLQRWLAAVPLGRVGRPDDVADAVLFLASPMARWITGAELVVDGGVLSRPTW